MPRQQCDPVTRQVCEQVAKEVRFIIYQLRRFTLSACRAFIPIDDAQSYRMQAMFLRFSPHCQAHAPNHCACSHQDWHMVALVWRASMIKVVSTSGSIIPTLPAIWDQQPILADNSEKKKKEEQNVIEDCVALLYFRQVCNEVPRQECSQVIFLCHKKYLWWSFNTQEIPLVIF